MRTCYCCMTARPIAPCVLRAEYCTCSGETCRRHAPICTSHCHCGMAPLYPYVRALIRQAVDRVIELDDPSGPFATVKKW